MTDPSPYLLTAGGRDDLERDLMNPDTWDWDDAEVLPGNPDVLLELVVPFDREQVTALAVIAARDHVNPIDLIRRYVDERLATERGANAQPLQVAESA